MGFDNLEKEADVVVHGLIMDFLLTALLCGEEKESTFSVAQIEHQMVGQLLPYRLFYL